MGEEDERQDEPQRRQKLYENPVVILHFTPMWRRKRVRSRLKKVGRFQWQVPAEKENHIRCNRYRYFYPVMVRKRLKDA